MEPSLQRVQLHVSRTAGPGEAQGGEAAQPIQLHGPSVWPLLLSVSVVVFAAGLLFIDNYPWLSLITIPYSAHRHPGLGARRSSGSTSTGFSSRIYVDRRGRDYVGGKARGNRLSCDVR